MTVHGNVSQPRQLVKSEAQSSYATAQEHVSSTNLAVNSVPKDTYTEHEMNEAVSLSYFETASFHVREAELQTIERRFADVPPRRNQTPFISRFKEDFGNTWEPVKRRTSLIPTMINLRVPGRVRYRSRNSIPANSEPQLSNVPQTGAVKKTKTRTSLKERSSHLDDSMSPASRDDRIPRPSLKESATDLWQRAIRQEAEQRRGTSSKSGLSRRTSPSHSKSSLNPNGSDNVRDHIQGQSVRGKYLEVPKTTRATNETKLNKSRRPPHGNKMYKNLYEGWPKLPMDLAMAPESWARYPSHNRTERNAHAQGQDNVISQDFAARTVSSDGQIGWTTDGGKVGFGDSVTHRTVSVQDKLGKAVKSGIIKLLPFAENIREPRSNSLGRRRGSFQLAGEVEYPELEVLPSGIGHILEPEQIEDALSSRKRSRASSNLSFGWRSTTMSLANRTSINRPKQLNGTEDGSKACRAPLVTKSMDVLPRIPLGVLGHDDKQSTPGTEVFMTPLSSNLKTETLHDKKCQQSRLPVAKSDQALRNYEAPPKDVSSASWMRSFTWSGSLTAPDSADKGAQFGRHELQFLHGTGHLNASEESFATRASFATAAG